jgi:hypothetical protein
MERESIFVLSLGQYILFTSYKDWVARSAL